MKIKDDELKRFRVELQKSFDRRRKCEEEIEVQCFLESRILFVVRYKRGDFATQSFVALDELRDRDDCLISVLNEWRRSYQEEYQFFSFDKYIAALEKQK